MIKKSVYFENKPCEKYSSQVHLASGSMMNKLGIG
jgi:hypothetical protein